MTKSDKNVMLYGLLFLALMVAATVAVIIHTGAASARTPAQPTKACTLEVGTISGILAVSEDGGQVARVTYAGGSEWYTFLHMGQC